MKNAQGYSCRILGHCFILAAGLAVCVTGCGGSNPAPPDPTPVNEAAGAPTTETLTPPGGMELPSDIDVSDLGNSDSPGSSAESGTSSFELPE